MKIRIVNATKYIVLGIFITLAFCVHIDGKNSRRSVGNSSLYLQSCGDEIDKWSCNEGDDSSSEQCIDKPLVCDGDVDCGNGADERNCTECPSGNCENEDDGFSCYVGGEWRCFPCSFVCDGDNDCGDWEDEGEECADEPCKLGYFRCDSGRCIDDDKTCDGVADCWEGDDESYRLCRRDSSNGDEWYITLVVIGVLLFLVVLCSVVTTKYRRGRRNNRRNTGGSARDLDAVRTSISMEMTFPTGPPSYEATMSATMSVNPAFSDANSINSSDIPADDDLPPPYESIANETVQSQIGISENGSAHPTEQVANQTVISTPSSENTESRSVNRSTDESSSSSPPAAPVSEPSPTLDDEGRHI